jgi:hypothetical protein
MNPLDSPIHRDPQTGEPRIAQRYKLLCRSAPLGPWSHVDFQGKHFAVESVQEYDGIMSGNAVRRVEAILREVR